MQFLISILTIFGLLPKAWEGVKWVVNRTKTKKDDALVKRIDGE